MLLLRDAARIVRDHLLEAPYQLEFPRTGRARWGHTLRVTAWELRLVVEVEETSEQGETLIPQASLDRAHELFAGLMGQPIGPFELPTGHSGQVGRGGRAGQAIDVGALVAAGILHDVAKYDIRPEDAGRLKHGPLAAEFARELLSRDAGLPKPFVDLVEGLIRFHSAGAGAQSEEVLRTFGGRVPIELPLIKDADGLDELGAQFVLLDARHLGAEPDVYPAYLTRSAERLPQLYSQDGRFHTKAAKRHYQRFTGVVRTFVGSLEEEIAGQLWEGELLGDSSEGRP